ncbi:MAG: hypothetical protein DME65_10365 [Verrucomicrobia bacterium]|nr:MAG: hypothetical protein DME65_10365 [Verrucomicrobiota bacterium]
MGQASVTEKRTDRGQDTSGHGSWMNVCVKRGDKWLISATTPLGENANEVRPLRASQPPTFSEKGIFQLQSASPAKHCLNNSLLILFAIGACPDCEFLSLCESQKLVS